MTELRWILLAVGLLVVAGVYLLWGRDWGAARDRRAASEHKLEPTFSNGEDSFDELIGRRVEPAEDSQRSPEPVAGASKPAAQAPAGGDFGPVASDARKIITLHVACRGSQRIGGPDLDAAMQAERMQLGQFDIYHRLSDDGKATVFSAANMVEPGTFDASKLEELSTPGLSLFLLLPGPIDGAEAFSDMLISARSLAQRLGAEVLDDQGSSLSNQTAGHIREEILAFQLRLRALAEAGA